MHFNIIKISFIAILLLMINKVGYAFDVEVRKGDLIFQASAATEFSKAINTSARQPSDSLTFCHVAIIDVDDCGRVYIIEAEPKNGVRRVPVEQFIAESVQADGKPMVVVKRLTVPFSPDKVIANAMTFIGQDYDHEFMPDNDKMYCSELVYEAFLDEEGEHIFKATPMNFRNSNGEMPQFWIEKFGKMGVPIPEGELGTHPDALARTHFLITIE